jgi:hypothetical protein
MRRVPAGSGACEPRSGWHAAESREISGKQRKTPKVGLYHRRT